MFGFFKKKNADGSEKLPGPKTIPNAVGQVLVVNFKEDPNWAWALKAVMKPKEGKDIYHIRVFAELLTNKAKLSVKDYHSLDDHPDMILYDGIYDKKNGKAQLENKYKKT